MPTRTGTWNPKWSIGYMRTKKSASILEEYLMWNGEHSPHWFLRQRVGWGNNALGSLSIGRAHCLKERRAIFLSHLLGKSPSFVCAFCDLLLSVEEAPGTLSKFSVTRRTITLVLTLLKEPSLSSFYRQFLHFSISACYSLLISKSTAFLSNLMLFSSANILAMYLYIKILLLSTYIKNIEL